MVVSSGGSGGVGGGWVQLERVFAQAGEGQQGRLRLRVRVFVLLCGSRNFWPRLQSRGFTTQTLCNVAHTSFCGTGSGSHISSHSLLVTRHSERGNLYEVQARPRRSLTQQNITRKRTGNCKDKGGRNTSTSSRGPAIADTRRIRGGKKREEGI